MATATAYDQEPQLERSAVTPFSLAVGSLLCIFATNSGTLSRYVWGSGTTDKVHLTYTVVAPFLLLVVALARRLNISRGEWLVIFSMGMIGATMPTYFIGRAMAFIAVPYYAATPENQWGTYFLDQLPNWLIIQPGNALTWYYEGLPAGASIPWSHWLEPLFWWGTVIGAFYGMCLAIIVMFRKQWVEHERIRYPLMEAPLAIVDPDSQNRWPMAMMASPLFWGGFGISFFIIAWNILGWFNPGFTPIKYDLGKIGFGPIFPAIPFRLQPVVIGFTYFANQNIAFSLWFFNILSIFFIGLLNSIGFTANPITIHGGAHFATGALTQGALISLVVFVVWNGRRHLALVLKKALHDDPGIDDSDEMMSYRSALIGFVLCFVHLCAFQFAVGMSPSLVAMFMVGVVILFIGMTRIIIESGIITLRAPQSPQDLTLFTLGSQGLTQANLIGVAMSAIWVGDLKTTVMPALAHSTKLHQQIRSDQRKLLTSILTAMVVGVLATFVCTLYVRYTHGGLETAALKSTPWGYLVAHARQPTGPLRPAIQMTTIGIVVMAVLLLLRYRFPLSPFHPVGFAAGPAYPVNYIVGSIFVTWVVKVALQRFGGGKRIEAAKPFFIGLILGHFFGILIGLIVDRIWFPIDGHSIEIAA